MKKECYSHGCNRDCNQGRTCPAMVRMPTEYEDYDFEFRDSVFDKVGRLVAIGFASFGAFMILAGVAGYSLYR